MRRDDAQQTRGIPMKVHLQFNRYFWSKPGTSAKIGTVFEVTEEGEDFATIAASALRDGIAYATANGLEWDHISFVRKDSADSQYRHQGSEPPKAR
jgi:hypothetical protein